MPEFEMWLMSTQHRVTIQITEQLSRYRRIQNTIKHLIRRVLQRTMPGYRYATRNISEQVGQVEGERERGGGGVELRNFDKHFVKNTRKRGPTGKQFGNFSPRYSQNYILNGKFNPKMNTIRNFLSKIRTPFSI